MKPLLGGGVLEMTRGRETGKADAEYWFIGRGVMMLCFMESAWSVLIESRLLEY